MARGFCRCPVVRGQTETPSPPRREQVSMKRIAAVLTLAGAIFGVVAPTTAFADPGACVHLYLNVNGTEQTIDQCAPLSTDQIGRPPALVPGAFSRAFLASAGQ